MTLTIFLVIVLASIGMHRIYNFESLFQGWHRLASRGGRWTRFLSCPACNAFWIALGCTGIAYCPHGIWALAPFATYPFVRASLWVYDASLLFLLRLKPTGTTPSPVLGGISTPQEPIISVKPPCRTCQSKEKATAIKDEQERYLSYEKRVVIMTAFADWNPSYSLTSVVLDHARMLAANERWFIQIWVNTTCNLDGLPQLPANVEVKKVLPPISLTADYVDPKAKEIFSGQVLPHFMVLGNATIITHDLLFVSSYVTIAAAIHETLGHVRGFTWFHVCHSAPAVTRPTEGDARFRASAPEGHRLLCLAPSQIPALAAYYGVDPSRISAIPNGRDLRILSQASTRVAKLVHDHRLCEADVVQVFPLSTPRACDKGLSHVIRIFAEMSKNAEVRLVVANAHANSNEAAVVNFHREAKAAGLPADALIFTSEAFPDLAAYGLPMMDVQTLFQFSNLFIFPTISEACSLTLMEAALAGNLLVLNGSVPSLLDIVPKEYCITYDWGNLVERPILPNPVQIAKHILGELDSNRANLSKRAVLRTHNLDTIGAKLRAIVAA